ncbi:hypothetical protein [Lysobacter gummosus]
MAVAAPKARTAASANGRNERRAKDRGVDEDDNRVMWNSLMGEG